MLIHLFPANLGDSACISEKVQAISAVRQVRRPVGHDSAAAMSKLVALLPNYMQIVQNWSEKGVLTRARSGGGYTSPSGS